MTRTSRRRAQTGLLATLVAGALLLSGCGQQETATGAGGSGAADRGTSGSHKMADGSTMSAAEMAKTDSHGHDDAESASAPGSVTHREGAGAPSAAAAMICSKEIADSVRSTFELRTAPSAVDGWSAQRYTCTYRLPGGRLRLSVQDLDQPGPGRAWFDALSNRLGARTIRGVASLGFPAAETPVRGNVLFLKDDKTLLVDATAVGRSDLPKGLNRTEAAYGVAASVIACWSE